MKQLELPSEAMLSPSITAALTAAGQGLSSILEMLETTYSKLFSAVATTMAPVGNTVGNSEVDGVEFLHAPLVFTPALLDAVASARTCLEESYNVVHGSGLAVLSPDDSLDLSGIATVRDVFPSWNRLEAMLSSGVAEANRLCRVLPALPFALSGTKCEAGQPLPNADAHPEVFAKLTDAAQTALKQTLLWAQGTQSSVTQPDENGPLRLPQAMQILSKFLQSSCARRLCSALTVCVHNAPKMSSDASGLESPLHLRLLRVLGCSQTMLTGMRACVIHAVLLHAATGELAVAIASMFIAYVREGFGEGEGEVDEGEGGDGAGVV